MSKFLSFLSLLFLLFACQQQHETNEQPTSPAIDPLTTEARDDSIALVRAYEAQDLIEVGVPASVETKAARADAEEDAADDPAIWVHPTDPGKSLVFGSNKTGGLAVYNLDGEEVAYYPIGNVNNVDVLYNFPYGDGEITLLGCSNRSDQSIDIFRIDPEDGRLEDVAIDALAVDSNLIDDIYGFCFASLGDGRHFAVINGKNGLMQQFELVVKEEGIDINLARSIQFDTQTEGMVADNELGYLYVGEEAGGVWKLRITPNDSTRQLIPQSNAENPQIVYDIEGLSIYASTETTGYLLASIQGNFSYAVYEREGDNRYLGSFKIIPTEQMDGAEETDGLDVISEPLGANFPQGLLVVQDGFNYDGEILQAQNFKYISWAEIANLLLQDSGN